MAQNGNMKTNLGLLRYSCFYCLFSSFLLSLFLLLLLLLLFTMDVNIANHTWATSGAAQCRAKYRAHPFETHSDGVQDMLLTNLHVSQSRDLSFVVVFVFKLRLTQFQYCKPSMIQYHQQPGQVLTVPHVSCDSSTAFVILLPGPHRRHRPRQNQFSGNG